MKIKIDDLPAFVHFRDAVESYITSGKYRRWGGAFIWLFLGYLMKDDLEHRFVWKEDRVDCPACAPYFTLGFQTYDDDERFREFLQNGSEFEHVETVESYFTKPRFTLWFLLIGSRFIKGGEIYRCKTCNQIWAHSDADNAWRGYFRPISEVKPKTDAA